MNPPSARPGAAAVICEIGVTVTEVPQLSLARQSMVAEGAGVGGFGSRGKSGGLSPHEDDRG